MTKEEIKERLLKGIQRRLSALAAEPFTKPLPYELHEGHWIRDLTTFRAFLLDHPDIEQMVNNMPE